MPTDSDTHEDDDDDDRDAPLASDLERADDDDDDDDMVCPACGKGVAIDTPKCPHCGDWIRPVVSAGGSRGKWFKIVVIILLGTGVVQLLMAIF
jgi:hypothetical protein